MENDGGNYSGQRKKKTGSEEMAVKQQRGNERKSPLSMGFIPAGVNNLLESQVDPKKKRKTTQVFVVVLKKRSSARQIGERFVAQKGSEMTR